MKSYFLIALSILLLSGCGNKSNTANTGTGDTTTVGPDTTDRGIANDTWDKNKVDEFVLEVASAGLMEVQLGQMVEKMAVNNQVREFGKMMVKDHSDANNKLKSVAENMQLNIPTTLMDKHQSTIDNLKNEKGKDFDKAYMNKMIDDHKDDINKLESAQNNVTDPDLKNWINTTLPVLRSHLESAQRIQDQLKN